jgi:hypothetical protein
VAADFFTVEMWTRRGLQRFVVLFFSELSTRKAEIAGIAAAANGLWMSQIGRNLTDAIDGIPNGNRYLIRDRDPLFTAEFLRMQHQGILPGARDLVRRGLVAQRHSRICSALPWRAKPPRSRQPVDHAG